MSKRERRETKSPFREAPLRAPGESLSEEIQEQAYGRILPFVLGGWLLVVLAVFEWLRLWLSIPPQPIVVTAVAVLGCAIIAWRVKGQIRALKCYVEGEKGEKFVGQKLEELREKGYRVFHDIVSNGHNIDHALVGPGGVFSIETKSHRKPARGQSEVVFDGENVTVNGYTPDRNPVDQAQAAARELRGIIHSMTGREVNVRPVLIYPGWFTTHASRDSDVWVLNENALPKWLDKEQAKLTGEDIALIADRIARHVRQST